MSGNAFCSYNCSHINAECVGVTRTAIAGVLRRLSSVSQDVMVAGQIDSLWIEPVNKTIHMVDWKRFAPVCVHALCYASD